MTIDFHTFVSRLLTLWLIVYVVALLVSLVPPLGAFILSCFDFAPTYYGQFVNTLRQAAIWLVPTALLWVAYYLSRPRRRFFHG